MKSNIREIKIEQAKNIVKDRDILRQTQKDKEPIFRLDKVELRRDGERNPLLELEIALRRCERVGMFKK